MAEKRPTPKRSYGTGSLYVRTDGAGRETWYGKWRSNGHQRKKAIGPKRLPGTRDGLTKPEAERRLRALMAEHRAPGVVEILDVAELGRRYIRELQERGQKESYIEGPFKSSLRTWLEPFFADKPIDRITQDDIRDLAALMRQGERPDGRKVRPLSNKTITNHIWSTLSSMLKYAIEEGWLTSNPLQGIRAPKIVVSGDIKFLEPDDVVALVAAARPGDYQQIDAAMYLTAAKTGLRLGELIGLRWMDVDWKANRVRVVQSWAPRVRKMTTPKSERSRRSVPLVDEVAAELDRLFVRSAHQADDDLVFADPLAGGPLNPNRVRERFIKALDAAGLGPHTFHHLRHTFGTRMAAVGTPMRTLQAWMGHKNISTTQRYADYAPAPEHERELVEMAFRVESIEPVSELDVATVAAWVREHRPDVWEQATGALAVAAT